MSSPEGPAEFGPRGYLPEQAAKRARKIVLREQMGLGWPVAALVAGALLVGLGVVYLLTVTGPPAPPYVDAGRLDAIDPRGAASVDLDELRILVVRGGGGVRVFAHPGVEVTYCPASRRLESSTHVWTLQGQLTSGSGASLRRLPAHVHDGDLYVNPTAPRVAAPTDNRGERPRC